MLTRYAPQTYINLYAARMMDQVVMYNDIEEEDKPPRVIRLFTNTTSNTTQTAKRRSNTLPSTSSRSFSTDLETKRNERSGEKPAST